MPKYYEQWILNQLIDLSHLSSQRISTILNTTGFLGEFRLNNLTFKKFLVVNDHIQAIYTADIPGDAGDDWNNCDIFIRKTEYGAWMAEFGGTPNHPADDDETFAARHNL